MEIGKKMGMKMGLKMGTGLVEMNSTAWSS
jgi:hypothetical protein